MPAHPLAPVVDAAFERRTELSPTDAPRDLLEALDQVVDALNAGTIRV